MRAVAMTLEGVLRKPLDEHAQDVGGWMLYAALVSNFRVVVLGTDDPKRDEHFLLTNGMNKHVKVEPIRYEDAPTDAGRKRAQISRLRREGFQFEFIVVPDPELARQLYATGVAVLTYLHPLFSAESFRPDYDGGIRAWDELEAEVDYQRTAKAEQLRERAQ